MRKVSRGLPAFKKLPFIIFSATSVECRVANLKETGYKSNRNVVLYVREGNNVGCASDSAIMGGKIDRKVQYNRNKRKRRKKELFTRIIG